ncbi:amino acid permease [Kineococcus rubinsiae]|uniref:amino acid permease n=1 Tax=Kineococcus rubinsiae TaxID=2609562 RepID=UPI001431BDAB|nr:amino acid permease [Kineococcus rubinsiae]NIZ93306.1 amino acid permease [Kineococcus rubinsiae]
MGIFRTKSVEDAIATTDEPGHRLKKSLGAWDLTVFGVGVIIGTGIFVLTGEAAGTRAGPAVAISFVVSGIVCALAALCYAEFASTVPVAGSAYTFSYASLGEVVAWIIGWDLILELALGAATVAVGWSSYAADLLDETLGLELPAWLYSSSPSFTSPNLIAAGVIVVLTLVLCVGTKASARVNAVIVGIKLLVVAFVIVAGLFYVKASNYSPFIPPTGAPSASSEPADPALWQDLGLPLGTFGVGGILTAAALVFFAFIGFDIVATAAEETKNPQRDMPRGIFGSLAICTGLYVVVSLIITGMVKYDRISVEAPLAAAFRDVGADLVATLISVGTVVGLLTVMMILMLGQNRVLFAMSRDRLIPGWFSLVNDRTGVPVRITAITGAVVAVVAAFTPISDLAEMVNIGTLFAFVLVSIGVIVLRRTRPDLPRAFRMPLVPVLPIISAVAAFVLMGFLPGQSWVRLGVWMVIGLVVYLAYGYRKSRLAAPAREDAGSSPS